MRRLIKLFLNAHLQTKFFIFTVAIYILALGWTTAQAYLRLEFHRAGMPTQPIMIPQKTTEQP